MLGNVRTRLLLLPRRWKQGILVGSDLVTLSFALWAAFCLRYDRWYLPENLDQWAIIVSAALVAIPIFLRLGLYRAVVRYLPERALWVMVQAMVLSTGAWVVLVFLSEMAGRGVVPRSVPVIYLAIGLLLVAGTRFAAKWLVHPKRIRQNAGRKSVLIYGAGEPGIQLAQSLASTHRVVGFLDDNNALQNREIAGVRVYSPTELNELVEEHDVKDVILSVPSISAQKRKQVAASLSDHRFRLLSLPAIGDLVTGKYSVSQIKEIDAVELLGRSSVPPDPDLIKEMVVGRSIMVTGAGGSIGSELCRKISGWRPQRLVLFEANEFALYQIEKELSGIPDVIVVPILGSVVDRQSVENAISTNDIKVVFHAAAHKHVPLVEANAIEGIRNNVLGTEVVASTSLALGVESFVLISTDKAVRPTNVMGATKRWAELLIGHFSQEAGERGQGQRFCAVRFGNVLGSNGSVVPLFKEQIARGGPITLTDPNMTRYFMSIQEAAELIVQAGALSEGGDVFLLDMGEPMLISELAENMIRLAGLSIRTADNQDGDIEVAVVGKRPGEKMYEELFYDASSAKRTRHPKISSAIGRANSVDILDALNKLRPLINVRNEHDARQLLFEIVDKSS